MSQVRVRFAPSPTGHLHLGGARTALFNWLFARHHQGTFILRIEDTDQTRSTPEAVEVILKGLAWLGLSWDEGPGMGGSCGPYFQAERLEIYRKYAEELKAKQAAYECYCLPEELEAHRKEAERLKLAPKYSGKCRSLSEADKHRFQNEGKIPVLRFRSPEEGTTVIQDLIRGSVSFKNELLDDFVLVKSDGFPAYNFAAVVDDALMKITHVIRGDDHLSNTPRQLLLYPALGFTSPQFAHIPMILGADKSRLSKRHGATSLIEYQALGYLPHAMMNYLARLGWSHGDQEIFSQEELVHYFSLEKVGKAGAIFNLEKLGWLNGHYIRKLAPEELLPYVEPHLKQAYSDFSKILISDRPWVLGILRQVQDRLRLFPEVVELSQYFFTEDYAHDPEAEQKYLKGLAVPEMIRTVQARLAALSSFTKDEIEKVFKELARERGVKLGEVIHPIRVVLTGRAESPPMYDVVEILGRQTVLERLGRAGKRGV